MKKTPSKVAHNRPRFFFFSTGPGAQKQNSRTIKSPFKMQDWVFRLGPKINILEENHCTYFENTINVNGIPFNLSISRTLTKWKLFFLFSEPRIIQQKLLNGQDFCTDINEFLFRCLTPIKACLDKPGVTG